jgi:superfamily II DNA or RNA helicase
MIIRELLEFIKFDSRVKKQTYTESQKRDFASLQAEGVTDLINKMDKYQIALLADEVGMGKTFQALAVIANQFRIKEKSKVLVITPRKEVLNQWKNEEYSEFYNNHFVSKEKTLPFPVINQKGKPQNIKKEIVELYNFRNGLILDDNNKIVFAKSTSFSTGENLTERKEKLLKNIKEFDLIVIDEAHKFRNYNDGSIDDSSLIVKTANMLFSNIKENTKILLLTATPRHSKKGDLSRIVNLFGLSSIQNKSEEELMNQIMVRRLRVMSNGQNKYTYRNECASKISLTDTNTSDFKNELFFAMLQREYAKDESSKDLTKSRYLLDFLEGTNYSEDYLEKEEFDISLEKIVIEKYRDIYNEVPSNKKYKSLLDMLHKKDETTVGYPDNEKSLVFVRRTASAYEITRQFIENFDKAAWEMIDNVLDIKTTIKMPKSRTEFEQLIQNKLNINLDEKIDQILNSDKNWEDQKVIDYVERYRKNPDNIPLDQSHITTNSAKKLILSEYFEQDEVFSLKKFLDFISNKLENKAIEEIEKTPKSVVLDLFKKKKGVPSTDASRFLQKFTSPNSLYSKFFEYDFRDILNHIDYNESKYKLIKSAILHASIGLVELYCCYLEAKTKYERFVEIVKRKEEKKQLSFTIQVREFLEHFDKFEKYLKFNINNMNSEKEEDKVLEYNHEIFYGAQPSFPYVGSTKNETVISRFNSPFFPILLCGTSTLQEGVNLHLFCNKVYHFGSAHTMGDDEQRVGRVDRLMGKMDRELQNYSNGRNPTLDIYYPYLESTYDEFNLKKMLCSKRSTEKLIDKATEIIVEESNIECTKSIEELLHKPNILLKYGND